MPSDKFWEEVLEDLHPGSILAEGERLLRNLRKTERQLGSSKRRSADNPLPKLKKK